MNEKQFCVKKNAGSWCVDFSITFDASGRKLESVICRMY